MRITLLLWIIAGVLSPAAHAQPSASLDRRITDVLARMASRDRGVRNKAFDDMLGAIAEGQSLGFDPEYGRVLAGFSARHPEQADRVKVGFINLLKADNVPDETLPAGYSAEDNSEHSAAVIDIVASLDDERAIPALVGAMTTGGMATGGLIKYGQKALGPVLLELSNPNPLVRSTAVSTAITILRMKNDAASQAQISGLIRTAIRDPEYALRYSAVSAIENLSDQKQFVPALQEFVPTLQEMEQHDPFIIPGGDRYPMRDRTKKLLEKIANH